MTVVPTTSATITVADARAAREAATGFVIEEFNGLTAAQYIALGRELPLLTAALVALAQADVVLTTATDECAEKVKATMRATLRDLAKNGDQTRNGGV